MRKLVLLRHGESIWNRENRFTGWTDVDLSEKGMEEAREAGDTLKREGLTPGIAYTSVLKRAIRTLWIVLDRMDLMWIPVERSWRLNEKHYGALQGLNKKETALKYGNEQVLLWRRDYGTRPPALEKSDKRYPGNDPRYAGLDPAQIPATECLRDTVERFLPYWHGVISAAAQNEDTILISAHGNSLRALVKYLDDIPDEKIVSLNIPTGIPLVYELDNSLKPVRHYYVGDPDKVREATERVAAQGRSGPEHDR